MCQAGGLAHPPDSTGDPCAQRRRWDALANHTIGVAHNADFADQSSGRDLRGCEGSREKEMRRQGICYRISLVLLNVRRKSECNGLMRDPPRDL